MMIESICQIKSEINLLEERLKKLANLKGIDEPVMFVMRLANLINKTGYSLNIIFILWFAEDGKEFTQDEVFELLGVRIKSKTFRDLFRGTKSPDYKEIISTVGNKKGNVGNTRIYTLTDEGKILAKKIRQDFKEI